MSVDVRLTSRAQQDWQRLSQPDRRRLVKAFAELRPGSRRMDEKPLVGVEPWRRLRVGDHRVIFRPLTDAEAATLDLQRGYLVERIIDRRDLEKAVNNLR